MSVSSSRKPTNQERRLPTVSFSLPEAQIERLRELAWARDVSLSEIARDALETAFACWREDPVPETASGERALARWPRNLRRQAARDGAVES